MSNRIALARRSFLGSAAAIGGGFALGWRIPATPGKALAQSTEPGQEVGIWAVISPDDTTTIRIARSEMGQGTLTGLAQLVADELDCDWTHVRAEYVSPEMNLAHKRAWGDMSTGGSRGIRGSVDYVRKGGAAARAMLIDAAAHSWGVPASECTAANSVITHAPSNRTIRYGQVAAAAAQLPVPTEVKLKTPAQWTLIGKGAKRLDTVDKLSGKQVFAIDVQLPDMLNAAIAQCPVFGGTLQSFDAGKIS
jgi:isoquinoline 1-oxidoreductase beta subunit